MAVTICDSCTDTKECRAYELETYIFYWCEDCVDDEGIEVNE